MKNKTIKIYIKFLHVTDELEGGPELGGITVEILVDRLLVKLINEPFDIPT